MKLGTVLRLRCPRCGEGQVFKARFQLNDNCPKCDLHFNREPGYFVGALYASYALSLLLAAPVAVALWWVGVPAGWNALAVAVWILLWSPWIVRISRVAWLHMDQRFDPR
jgi:uncharacterized protein (DUF983 family)